MGLRQTLEREKQREHASVRREQERAYARVVDCSFGGESEDMRGRRVARQRDNRRQKWQSLHAQRKATWKQSTLSLIAADAAATDHIKLVHRQKKVRRSCSVCV